MPGLGVLGGSFDPIHEAHLAIARAALAELELQEVLILPCARSPHKASPPLADAQHRRDMIELAIVDEPRLQLDARELEAGLPVPTVETLRALTRERGQALWLLVGEDSFRALDSWTEPEELARLCSIAVAARSARPATRSQTWRSAAVHWLQLSAQAYSSTRIREALATGQRAEGLAPRVEAYIRRHALYGRRAERP